MVTQIWNTNGKELFYRVGNKLMVVDVSTGPDPTLSQPRVLFEQRYAFGNPDPQLGRLPRRAAVRHGQGRLVPLGVRGGSII